MAWQQRRQRIRVTLNGVEIPVMDGVAISEQLGNAARTAEFSLASEPAVTPAGGQTVLIELLDADADGGTVWALFGGTVSPQEIESEPFGYVVRAVDQLELLRATNKSGDMNLTGMTTGEAWKAVAGYCGVTYDDADIFDDGHVLGERVPVYWHDDASTAGAAIIADLDAVTGCATMTIGNNRVIRIPVDPVPADATGLYATYEKGVDLTFSAHRRSRGDRDGVQNVWSVRGATAELSETCTGTPWAFAVAGNAQIGRKVRTPEQSFSSDLIQDEAHAEAMVRALMRRGNRVPDGGSVTLENDPNVHPGSKLRLIDRQYGIDTGAGGRLGCATSVNRTGLEMTVELEFGPPGAEGTVTHGVDKVCGDVHTNPDWPGDFEWPAADFPPLDAGEFADLEDYFADVPEFSVPDGELTCDAPTDLADCDAGTLTTGQTITAGADWEAEGTLTLTDQAERFELSIASDDGPFRFRIAGASFYDPTVGAFFYELTTPSQAARAPGHAPLGQPIAWRVRWTQATATFSLYADVGSDLCYIDQATAPGSTFAGGELTVLVTGAPTRSGEAFRDDCGNPAGPGGGGELVPVAWTIEDGNWSFGAGADADNLLDELDHFVGTIYSGDAPVDGVGWTMSGDLTLGDRCDVQVWIEEAFDFTGWHFQVYATKGVEACSAFALQVGSPDDGDVSADVFCWLPDVPITFTATRDAAAETFEVTVTQGAETRTLSVASTTAPVDNWRVAVYVSQDVAAPSTSPNGLLIREFALTVES